MLHVMHNGQTLFEITKANGEKSVFDPNKLFTSLTRSGASETQAQEIVNSITSELYAGISTKKIYRKAFALLKEQSRFLAARYNLKNAIMILGPSGYPFERFVGELLKHQGFKVEIATVVAGKCVNHEVDVIAEKDDHHFMIECKYHNQQGTVSDVKIPLYIQSRFLDVAARWKTLPGHGHKFHQGWLVTNTRFTPDAIQYGNCSGLKLIGWDYPTKGSLKDLIDSLGLYPLTTLTSLTLSEKKALLEMNLVLCHDLQRNEDVLKHIGIKGPRNKTILDECLNLSQDVSQRIAANS
jgi:Holliday junction resolvase